MYRSPSRLSRLPAPPPGLHLGWQPQENLLIEQAAAAAAKSDVAVVVVSDPVGEGMDRSTLSLPGDQDALVAAVVTANPRTVVVLNSGSANTMPWLDKAGAVVESWYGGQTAGAALTHVLFGDVNPSGKLPVTFPRSDTQVPAKTSLEYPGTYTDVHYDEGIQVGYRWYDATGQAPLFPFGFGLSFTTFRFDDAHATPTRDGYDVRVRVTNTGRRAGEDVVQVYVGSPSSAQEPPKQLKAYARISLRPHQTGTVLLHVARADLARWDTSSGSWVVDHGTYRFFGGDSSRNLPVSDTVRVR